MLREAGRPAVDTHVGALAVSFAAPPLPPVARLVVGGGVELRVLAASHQVVVRRHADADAPPLHVETVACGLPGGAPVRPGGHHASGPWELALDVARLRPAAFAAEAGRWLDLAATTPPRWPSASPATRTP